MHKSRSKKEFVSTNETFSRGPFDIPPNRRVANQFHRIFSVKAGMRTVCVESSLEADAIYWAESNPKIVAICEQPLRINVPISNRPFYTFDLSVRWDSGAEIFYEIKPESSLERLEDGKLSLKHWKAIEAICQKGALTSRILTDREINKSPVEIDNWKRLLPFARDAYEYQEPKFDGLILDVLEQSNTLTLQQLFAQLPNYSKQNTINHTAKLIHQGEIFSNLADVRLTGMTLVSKEPIKN